MEDSVTAATYNKWALKDSNLRPPDYETAVYARGRAWASVCLRFTLVSARGRPWVLLQRVLQYLDHRMGGRASCSLRTVLDAEVRDP